MAQFKIPLEYSPLYTTKNHARQINDILLKYSNKNSIVTDATSGIGGNTVFFCKDFYFVNAVEKDSGIIKTLTDNLSDYCNKQVLHSDYLSVMKKLTQNIIFMDPPWGGKGYKDKNKINLYLNSTDVYDIIESLYDNTDILCLKAPVNYDFRESKKWKVKKYPIYKFSHVNFNIIIYKK